MSRRTFDTDAYPGRPRILFVGYGDSSHTHSWVDLLDDAELNVRLFSLPTGAPPASWDVRTYVSMYKTPALDPANRRQLFSHGRAARLSKFAWSQMTLGSVRRLPERWLADVIREWRPDVIHTFGLRGGGEFYFGARKRYGLEGIGSWLLQFRGASDLTLDRLDEMKAPEMRRMIAEADQVLADNRVDLGFASELGMKESQLTPMVTVPGTGGIDIDALRSRWSGPTSSRRMILWPKAYEFFQSKALPVFEALKLAIDKIEPCEIVMLAAQPETIAWYRTLPESIRSVSRIVERVPRDEVLEMMGRARVMLAPSLLDGTPNAMFEAMASGAFPILSPLDTIRPVVSAEENVLFARNLYPNEIADALVRAMTDDGLVDAASRRNLELVGRIANRATIRKTIREYYGELARRPVGAA
jgi:hypothetical protein